MSSQAGAYLAMRQPMFQMRMQAAERLMALIDDSKSPGQHRRLATESVIRESCGAAGRGRNFALTILNTVLL